MKKYCYYCPTCQKVTLMTLVKEDQNKNTTFLKCIVCSDTEQSKNCGVGQNGEDLGDGIKEYSPKASYEVGDILFHKTFNDTGEVVKITQRLNGQCVNTVLFKTAGLKKLITIPK